MMRRIILPALLLLLAATPSPGAWQFAWQQDPGTDTYHCTLASDPLRVWTGPGNATTEVRINVQGEGLVTITSSSAPFSRRSLDRIGINVDDNAAINGPDPAADYRRLVFTANASVELHRQFEEGTDVLATVVFADQEPVTKRVPLAGYGSAVERYKGCRGLLLNTGWLGLSMTNSPYDERVLALLARTTPYRRAGVEVLVVDPRKAARQNGILPGDRIIAADGRETDVRTFIETVKALGPGGAVTLDILRDGTMVRLLLTRPTVTAREPDPGD